MEKVIETRVATFDHWLLLKAWIKQQVGKLRSNRQWLSFSSCEAKYQSQAGAVQEAIFLRSLLCEMGHEQSQPTIIGEDDQSCIKLTTNPTTSSD